MIKPDQLLQLVAHLQNEQDPASARNLLLRYIRKSSGAQLAALFTLNQANHLLELQAYSGHRAPQPPPQDLRPPQGGSLPYTEDDPHKGTTTTKEAPTIDEGRGFDVYGSAPPRGDRSPRGNRPRGGPYHRQRNSKYINTTGLFGAALAAQGFLHIPHPHADSRILPTERLWTDATGPLLLSAIHTNQRTEEAQGVLVLSFTGTDDPQQAQRPYEIEQNDTIRICTILLSNYLYSSNPAEAPAPDTNVEATPTTSTHPRQPTDPWFVTPTPMDALATLYELTLAISSRLSQQELYQHILTHMANVIDAPGACLLRHDPDQQQFHIVAAQGQQLPEQALLDALDSTELQRLALRGPGQNYVDLFIVGQRVALITLSCNCTLLGALALPLLPNTEQPATHITLLTYMGNVAALLLHNYDTQQAEYKALLDRERNRIARDIHDGVAQHIAHALHKLELIQRLLENQQCTQVRCEVQRAYSQVEDSLYKLRQCVASLRPLELENHTFTDALNALLAEYKSSYPEVRIISDVHALGQLPARLETPIFRLIQEACNNVYKHAHATHIILRLYIFSGLLIIEVQDDGIGMQEVQEEQTSSEQHMGLRAMKERVHEVGGYWELHSSPDSGTLVKAHFPLQGAVATLTNRERDILRLLIEGMTNRAIAERLSISQDTVKSHIHHIIQKMRVRDRTQAAVVATRQGWL